MPRTRFLSLVSLLLLAVVIGTLPAAARPAPTEPAAAAPTAASITVRQSDELGFSALVQVPTRQITRTQDPAGTTYSQIVTPGIDEPAVGTGGEIGRPAVPVLSYLLAIPQGSITPTVRIGAITGIVSSTGVLLYPIQPSPVDQTQEPLGDFGDPPFTIDRAAYTLDQNFPLNPVVVTRLGSVRDLNVVLVTVATGQYNPVRRELQLFSGIQFDVTFQGGNGFFLPARALDPFERQNLPMYERVVNYGAVQAHINPALDLTSCVGYEYLIVTDPLFRAAADTLASWKWKKGIATRVVETGIGTGKAGTTSAAIRAYIGSEYSRCKVRPSYVLLLGDAEFIPTFYIPDGTDGDGNPVSMASDLYYSVIPGAQDDSSFVPLPDLALGRIPVDTAAEAQTVVDKIVAYEKTPTTNANFYKRVTLASYFQCCRIDQADGTDARAFAQTSEQVRGYLQSLSYTVQRIYTSSAKYYADPLKTSYYDPARDATPRFYYNSQALPADLGPGSGAWNGTTTDVINAFNQGRFLIMHRDHGYSGGWADPAFSTTSINSLANGNLLPVVFSVNCTSGVFDNETDSNPDNDTGVYFAEKLLRKAGGGAVGILGDTRVSPTWENNTIARGFFDAVYPGFVPGFGGNKPHRRLGDILNHGKFYLLDQLFVSPEQVAGTLSSGNVRKDMFLYHVYGDPTMELWTSDPTVRLPLSSRYQPVSQSASGWVLDYPVEGATITLLQNGQPLGRAEVIGGRATITFVSPADPQQPIAVSASVADELGATLTPVTPMYLPVITR